MEWLNSTIGTFRSRRQAEAAARRLQRRGLDLQTLSLVGRDEHTDEHAFGNRIPVDGNGRSRDGGISCCRLIKELQGAGFFWIDGRGPFLVAGTLATCCFHASMTPEVVAESNVIAAGMRSLGIPRDSIDRYEAAVLRGAFLLIYCGTGGAVELAQRALDRGGAASLSLHASAEEQPPGSDAVPR